MKTNLTQILLNKILYVGSEIPEALIEDKREKFVLLGTPQELLDAVEIENKAKKKGEKE